MLDASTGPGGDSSAEARRRSTLDRLIDRAFGGDPDTRRIVRATWSLAWPVVLEQALAMVSQVVDAAMVGRLGKESTAAIGLSMQPFNFLNAVFMGLSAGTTALVARSTGAGNRDEAGQVAGQSILIALVLGLLISVAGFLKADWIIAFMKAEAPVRVIGRQYVQAMMPGMLLFFVFTIAAGALRGAGDTRAPMVINIGINAVHVLVNYFLIFGNCGFPRFGAAGAGISTSISRTLGGIAILIAVTRGRGGLRANWRQVLTRFDFGLFGRVLNVSVPAMLERALTSSGHIQYARMVAGLGTTSYAAHVLSLNVESFSYMPGMGFATAATALVGQSLGANDPRGAEKRALVSLRMGLLSMGTMGLLFFLFPAQFLRIFTDDAAVISRGIPLLRIVAFTQIPESLGFVIPGALRGAGDTRTAMYVTVVGAWLVRVGVTYILMEFMNLGLIAAWIAMFLDWVARSSLYWFRFKRGQWKALRV